MGLLATVCFLSLLITSTIGAAALPQHLRGSNVQDSLLEDVGAEVPSLVNSEEESGTLTSNESSDLVRSLQDESSASMSDVHVLGQFALNNKEHLVDPKLFRSKDQGYYLQDEVHNLTVGYKSYQDRLLSQQYIYKQYRFARIVEEKVSYPSNNKKNGRFVISFIEAYDQHSDPSDAGYVKIIKGGVGNRHVTLYLESKRNHGLKYLLRIWGHYSY